MAKLNKGYCCGCCKSFHRTYEEANVCCDSEDAWECSECGNISEEDRFECECNNK